MTALIKEVPKFKVDGGWISHNTVDQARDEARRDVLHKYLNRSDNYDGYLSTWEIDDWKEEKARKYHKKGFESGKYRGRQNVIDDMIRFYEDIQAQFKKIDEAKPVKEKSE